MKRMLFMSIILVIGQMNFAQTNVSAMDYYAEGHMQLQNGNLNAAFKNFKIAADMGLKEAMYDLACCYESGEGTSVDFNQAQKYYYKAATGNEPHSPAFTALGRLYLLGKGVEQNTKEAITWWKRGAETFPNDRNLMGGAECMYNLGLTYSNGIYVPQDFTQAIHWYRKAANLGLPVAAQALGKRYLLGQGVEKNETKAMKWFRIAAEADTEECAVSQFILGMFYLEGTENTPIDKKQALIWFKKAANHGYTDAYIMIIKLEEK